jgi:HAD superfamily hydrolase (TIGR01549 family)
MADLSCKAVIFDLDDTLVVLDVDWVSVEDEILRAMERDHHARLPASGITSLFNTIADKLGTQAFREAGKIAEPYEVQGARTALPIRPSLELLRKFHAKGIPVTICSSNSRASIQEALKTFKVDDTVESVVSREDVSRLKPDPQGMKKILGQVKLAPKDVLMIGDSKHDEGAARAAGIRFVHVSEAILSEP